MSPSIRHEVLIETGYAFDETYPPYHGGNWRSTERISKDFQFGYGGHYGWPNPPAGSNVGGPMTIVGTEIRDGLTPLGRVYNGKNSPYGYAGNFCVKADEPWWGTLPYKDGAAWGAEAFRKMKPTKPSMSGLNSLYELREFPATILGLKKRVKSMKDAGDYHLNLQFGWLPLISDVKKLINDQQKIQKRLDWLLRNNGRPVRIKKEIADFSYNGTEDGEAWGIVIPNGFNLVKSTPRYRRNVDVIDKIWASAQWRFFLPEGPKNPEYKHKLLMRLYGNQITPSVLYNAIPWSWLVDWFSNVGDIVENFDAGVADRLAAEYFYVMRNTGIRSVVFAECDYMRKNGEIVHMTGTALTESYVKTRLAGDPFGFSTNPNGLNASQLAILGALGMSRLK